MVYEIIFGVYCLAPLFMIGMFKNREYQIYTICITYALFPIVVCYKELFSEFEYYRILLLISSIMNFIFLPFIMTKKKKNFKLLVSFSKMFLVFCILYFLCIIVVNGLAIFSIIDEDSVKIMMICFRIFITCVISLLTIFRIR